MRRIITFFLLAFLLTGCTISTASDLNTVVENAAEIPVLRSNTHSYYFSYYLPSDVSEEHFNNNSVVMDYNGNKIVMNLNVLGIIGDNSDNLYDDGIFADDHKEFEYQGMLDGDRRFELRVYNHNERCVVHLNTSQMYLNSVCSAGDATSVADRMLLIAKNVQINEGNITKDFKTEDVIDYQRKQIDLFELIIAPDGRLEDLIINNPNDGEVE